MVHNLDIDQFNIQTRERYGDISRNKLAKKLLISPVTLKLVLERGNCLDKTLKLFTDWWYTNIIL